MTLRPLNMRPEHAARVVAARPQASKNASLTWHLAFWGAALILTSLVVFAPDPYLRIIRFLRDGLWVTIEVTLSSIIGALALGLITGLSRRSQYRWLRAIVSLYVEVIRGIPLLVQLFYLYYALGRFVQVPDMVAAVLAISVCYGAYMGEVYRAGIESIAQG